MPRLHFSLDYMITLTLNPQTDPVDHYIFLWISMGLVEQYRLHESPNPQFPIQRVSWPNPAPKIRECLEYANF